MATCNTPSLRTPTPLPELYALWEKFGDTPVFPETVGDHEAGTIEERFMDFPVGTPAEEIWAWFERQNPGFVVGDVMQGIRRP